METFPSSPVENITGSRRITPESQSNGFLLVDEKRKSKAFNVVDGQKMNWIGEYESRIDAE